MHRVNDKLHPKLHPLFPSQISATSDEWESVYSDHAPILCSIPHPDPTNSSQSAIKLVSWNVMSNDSSNALAPGKSDNCGETKAQAIERRLHVAASIKRMIAENQLSLLVLQEANEEVIQNILKELAQLGGWKLAPNTADGSAVFYQESVFASAEALKDPNDKILFARPNRLKLAGSHKTIDIYNCHGDYSLSPHQHEKKIKEYLSTADATNEVVVAGDFNATCIPMGVTTGEYNIGTAATPSMFDVESKQRLNAIDACFYSNQGAKQAYTEQLNPNTGKLYSPGELMQPLSNPQAKETVKKLKMGIGIGHDDSRPVINNLTLSEYTKFLQSTVASNEVILFPEQDDIERQKNLQPNAVYVTKDKNNKILAYSTDKNSKISKPKKINAELMHLAYYQFPKQGEDEKIINVTDRQLIEEISGLILKWKPTVVRASFATNMLNQRGIGIEVPEALYDYLQQQYSNLFEFTSDKNIAVRKSEPVYQVLCKEEHVQLLHKAITTYVHQLPLKNAQEKLHEQLAGYGSANKSKHTRQLSLDRIKSINTSALDESSYYKLIYLEKYAMTSARGGENSVLNATLNDYLTTIGKHEQRLTLKDKVVVSLLKFIAERETSVTFKLYDASEIIKFAGKLAYMLYFAKNKEDYKAIEKLIETSNVSEMRRSTEGFNELLGDIKKTLRQAIIKGDDREININNGATLFNVNAYDYLKNIAIKIPNDLEKKYPYFHHLRILMLDNSGVAKSYQETMQYHEHYSSFLKKLQKDIVLITKNAIENKNDHIIAFVNSLYANDNMALERSGKFALTSLEASKIKPTDKAAGKAIADASSQGTSLFAVSPAQQEAKLVRFHSVISSTFQPQLKTSFPCKRNYAFHQQSFVTWKEFRFGTQGERISKGFINDYEVRVNPLFEAWLMAQNYALKKEGITHLYFNNLGIDRNDMEGKREKELSKALHQLESRHKNLAVITLPSDKGIMAHTVLHDASLCSLDDLKARALDIACETKINRLEKYDFHISDNVKKILYGISDDDGGYNKINERTILEALFDESITKLGWQNKGTLTSAESQAAFFHFIKFEVTKFIIEKLNPASLNFSCKDAIDRGGVSSLYFNLVLSIEKGVPMTKEEFLIGLHGAPTMVKGRGMNDHMERILNVLFAYVETQQNIPNKIPNWLLEMKQEYVMNPPSHDKRTSMQDMTATTTTSVTTFSLMAPPSSSATPSPRSSSGSLEKLPLPSALSSSNSAKRESTEGEPSKPTYKKT